MMTNKSLAVRYRPTSFEDLTEQVSIRMILNHQIQTRSFKQAYLFVGPAGCGKTTTARIVANEINRGQGLPIEIDAASHGNVDDIRELVIQAKNKPLDCEYKVFIIDECHCLSSAGWSAMLKLIEEPPSTAIFILATTDVQKVPKTIISRCQRFDFQRISFEGILSRLKYVANSEKLNVTEQALRYIAKIADGGMRDALTLLDKVLAYDADLTLEKVVEALGVTEYETMFQLTQKVQESDSQNVVEEIENLYDSGKDLKLFVKQYTQFVLDVYKILIGSKWEYTQLPELDEYKRSIRGLEVDFIFQLISSLVELLKTIRYSSSPKYDLEACLLVFIESRRQ